MVRTEATQTSYNPSTLRSSVAQMFIPLCEVGYTDNNYKNSNRSSIHLTV